MNRKILLFLFAMAFLVLAGFVVFASSKDDIVFPVAELGNCANEQACRNYCEQGQSIEACLAFAKKHNLLSQEEIDKAEKFLAIGPGPGGCTSAIECENYCNDINNINECLTFAEANDLMPPEELAEAKRVQAALQRGAKLPGNCRSKAQCESYCTNPNNMEECIAFAQAAGFMSPDELAEAQKVLAAIKKGAKPPPCQGKEACDEYCMEPNNFEECLTFAEAAGLIPPEELAQAKQALVAIKKGVKPPACRGKEECDRYCESNMEECIAFAEAAGMMSREEAEIARKTGGKGPGGCKGKEGCDAFCQDPANQETCFNFAKEHGLISEEQLREMEEGMRQLQERLSQAPPEVLSCLQNTLGTEIIEKIKAGTLTPSQQIGEQVRACFEQFMPQPGEMRPPEGIAPGGTPSGFTGPGGCTTQEECQRYCSDPANLQVCSTFSPPGGNIPQPPNYQPPPQEQLPQEPTGWLEQYLGKSAAFVLGPLIDLLK